MSALLHTLLHNDYNLTSCLNWFNWHNRNNKVPLYLAVNKCESETQGIAQAQVNWIPLPNSFPWPWTSTPYHTLPVSLRLSYFLHHTLPHLVLSPRVLLYAVLFYPLLLCSVLSSLCVCMCSIPFYSYLFFSVLFLALQEFWSLGLGQPYPISGIHGTGIGDLLGELLYLFFLRDK